MSVSQHWVRPVEISTDMFSKIGEDIRLVIPHWRRLGIYNVKLTENYIYVDGFYFPRIVSEEEQKRYVLFRDGRIHQFCNTNGSRMEEAAIQTLIVAEHYLKEQIHLSSDRDSSVWEFHGFKLVPILSYGMDFVLHADVPPIEETYLEVTWTTFKQEGNHESE